MEKGPKFITLSKVEKVLEQNESTVKMMKGLEELKVKMISIGEGGCAVVGAVSSEMPEKVELGQLDNICIKKTKEKPQIKCNDLNTEHEYQKKAQKAEVRTPLSLFSIKTDDGEYLVMERIRGYSVKDIMENNNLLPKKFEIKKFSDELESQIKKLHNAGIYHRDLHTGNVMIDEEGLPVIIDFGTATEGTGSEFTYEESVSMYDPKKGHYVLVNGYFKDDDEMVRNIKSTLKSLDSVKSLDL